MRSWCSFMPPRRRLVHDSPLSKAREWRRGQRHRPLPLLGAVFLFHSINKSSFWRGTSKAEHDVYNSRQRHLQWRYCQCKNDMHCAQCILQLLRNKLTSQLCNNSLIPWSCKPSEWASTLEYKIDQLLLQLFLRGCTVITWSSWNKFNKFKLRFRLHSSVIMWPASVALSRLQSLQVELKFDVIAAESILPVNLTNAMT